MERFEEFGALDEMIVDTDDETQLLKQMTTTRPLAELDNEVEIVNDDKMSRRQEPRTQNNEFIMRRTRRTTSDVGDEMSRTRMSMCMSMSPNTLKMA